jgi:hypothetical protein
MRRQGKCQDHPAPHVRFRLLVRFGPMGREGRTSPPPPRTEASSNTRTERREYMDYLMGTPFLRTYFCCNSFTFRKFNRRKE